jgi:phosphatidylglycerophosphate synthase
VRVALGPRDPIPALPGDLAASLPLSWSNGEGPLGRRLAADLAEASGEPCLVLAADTVIDARLLAHLAKARGSIAFLTGEGAGRAALLRLEGALPEAAAGGADLPAVAQAALASGGAKELAPSEFDAYIVKLRRNLPPYLVRVFDASSRARVERFLFWSNYKGSTDFLTRYVYPPLVWRALRPLARRRIHPNAVTLLGIAVTFAAVPFFAAGAWGPGLALAYFMSVLDSIDGKLARLTFTYSTLGDVLDHGLDIVHPPVWYLAWGYALSGGTTQAAPFAASLWLLGFYVLDRLCALAFRWRTGVSIHGATPLDERLRTFVSRRNPNLALFTLALGADALIPGPGQGLSVAAFYAIVAWQVACFAWHAERVVRFWNTRLAGRQADS